MQRGTGAGQSDWNKQNMREKEGMHGFDKDRAGFSNCVVRSPVFSRADSMFLYAHTETCSVCVCVSFTWTLTGRGSVLMKRASANCISAGGT